MILVMLYSIAMRYIFVKPITWGLELQSICFVILVFLGVGLSEHYHSSIEFEMIYNKFGKKTQNVCRIISNLLTVVFVGIMFIPSAKHILTMKTMTTVLRIPRSIVYIPFLIMLLSFIIRHFIWLMDEIKALRNGTYEPKYFSRKNATNEEEM